MARSANGESTNVHASPSFPECPSALDAQPIWRRWGPYLAARQWGTVREDYSPYGSAWEFFPHDHARSRAFRWGEDGLLGISDDDGLLCFALALWNGNDPILKERLFGLTGNEGNHGEDVKEVYYFLDNTPLHTYMKALYKYPQQAYPYDDLVTENGRRTRADDEYELVDTGIFAENRYFDIAIEYAKAEPEDIVIRIGVSNRGPDPAELHLLPNLWFRNTWAWGRDSRRPELRAVESKDSRVSLIHAHHWQLGEYWLACEGGPDLLFTENDTNNARLWGAPNNGAFSKDGINDKVVFGSSGTVNPDSVGTKAAALYRLTVAPGATEIIMLRLSHKHHTEPFVNTDMVLASQQQEADRIYGALGGAALTEDERLVQRQAYAGLLWSKQFYHYDLAHWLQGDPAGPPPPESRKSGRNVHWHHVNNADVLSMPDTWEYPWFAAWDLAFHCATFAHIDPEFAKNQLLLLLREWYMHPNGQLPAYEWAFGDVNPPVHAWAALEVYEAERQVTGKGDRAFLERVFHKLMLNFTWWVNRKDSEGRNLFQGGFLGLDNIGVFDRSAPLPNGGYLEQSDATAWMGMFSLNLMAIALELAREDDVYEDVATKFFEHFIYIANAICDLGGDGLDLWDDQDGFYYDLLMASDGSSQSLRVRSLVGLIPLLAVQTVDPDLHQQVPEFARRLRWFLSNRPELSALVPSWEEPGVGKHRLLSLVHGSQIERLLAKMLDPNQFLSDYGIRSISRMHLEEPYELKVDGTVYSVDYEPAESRSGLFGGNSNWRGPVWFPINVLLIDALRRFHHYFGDEFRVECPTGSGTMLSLHEVSDELSRRLCATFLRGEDGRRPVYGDNDLAQTDPYWRDNILFYEYFHGDTGAGLGASHQTGWTALVARLLTQSAEARKRANAAV